MSNKRGIRMHGRITFVLVVLSLLLLVGYSSARVTSTGSVSAASPSTSKLFQHVT